MKVKNMKPTEWNEKLAELKLVVSGAVNGLPWCGDLALQKVVHCLEFVYDLNLGYAYGYHHTWPYSFDLAEDLSMGIQSGEWSKKSEPIANGRYGVHQYSVLGESKSSNSQGNKIEGALGDLLGSLAAGVGRQTGRRLELVATIHFLRNKVKVSEEDLWGVLHGLKPKYDKDEFEVGTEQLKSLEQSARKYLKNRRSP